LLAMIWQPEFVKTEWEYTRNVVVGFIWLLAL